MKRLVFLILFIFIFIPKTYAQTTRIGGVNRYETAVNVSKSKFNTSEYVILVTGENYPDALCASPYAKLLDAPILLTQKSSLNVYTQQEIQRLNPRKVIIIGSEGVISNKVEEKINQMGIATERIYGTDRYETSLSIAQKIYAIKPFNEVFIASGENYPDALSAAPIAAIKEIPIILTRKNVFPTSIKTYIDSLNIQKSYVIGGVTVIYGSIYNQLPSPTRIYGKDRFETNKNIGEYFKSTINMDNIYIAVGHGPTNTEFADALTGAVAAAKDGSIILLTKNNPVDSVYEFILKHADKNTKLNVLGGTAAISDEQKIILGNLISSLNEKVNENSNSWQGINTVLGFTRTELIDINSRLSRCENQVTSKNAKLLIGYAKAAVIALINNPNYDYTLITENARNLKSIMSKSEKDEVLYALLNNFYNFDMDKLTNLRELLGV